MEVKLEKRYPIDASVAQVWAVLRDVPAVAGCMPGAAITDQIDATHYKGAVKVKVGPAVAAFAGDIEVLSLDETAQTVQLLGKGADKSGSTASMNLAARIEAGETPQQCVLVGDAAVIVNGKFAQFGGRMMVQVSDMILAQFADNFRIAAAAVPVVAEAVVAPETAAVVEAAPVVEPVADSVAEASAPADAQASTAPPAASVVAVAPPVHAPPPAAAPSRPAAPAPKATQELNALAIAWMLVKNWFSGLFGKRS